MSEASVPAQAETTQTTAPVTETQVIPAAPITTTQGLSSPDPVAPGFEFIPEQYRSSSWATKYKSADDFFKGIDGMAQVIGKKEIVNIQGVQVPANDAPDEAWEAFHAQAGRPESADKYEYTIPTDIKFIEGFDVEAEKKAFSQIVFDGGLNQKQADKLFKSYLKRANEIEIQQEQAKVASFDQALKQTFPENTEASLALAKKGAKALGIASKLDSEGLSLNPMVLQLCAKLGELSGEDSFVKSESVDSKESLLEEAKKLQMSPEYKSGNKQVHQKVSEIYQRVYDK